MITFLRHFEVSRAGRHAVDRVVTKLHIVVTPVYLFTKAVVAAADSALVSRQIRVEFVVASGADADSFDANVVGPWIAFGAVSDFGRQLVLMQSAVDPADQSALLRQRNSVILWHPMRVGPEVLHVGVFAVEIRALLGAKVFKLAARRTWFHVAAAVLFSPAGAEFAAIFWLRIVAGSLTGRDASSTTPGAMTPSGPVAPSSVDVAFVMRQIYMLATSSPTPHVPIAFAAIGPRHVMGSAAGVFRPSRPGAPQSLTFWHVRTDFASRPEHQLALDVTIVQFSRQHLGLLVDLILQISRFHGRSVRQTFSIAFV